MEKGNTVSPNLCKKMRKKVVDKIIKINKGGKETHPPLAHIKEEIRWLKEL
jgi:hypothetical protein